MIKIKRFVFNPFQVNCYILYNQSGECIIIDPSVYFDNEKDILVNFLESKCPKPQMIINTHGHVDHICGNQFLTDKYALKTGLHKDDSDLLNIAVEQGVLFNFPVTKPPSPDFFLLDKQIITSVGSYLEIRHAPGHSPGSIVIYSEKDNFIITGDVLFEGSIGRTDLPGGDYKTLINSIKEKILTLPDETVVYPGHGNATTIVKEKINNPFLQ